MSDTNKSPEQARQEKLAARNRKTIIYVMGAVIGMIGLAYASVPLYNIFCRVTGFGGTTQVALIEPAQTIDRTINIKFAANTERNMPWAFHPDIREVNVKVGAKKLISYSAKNMSSLPIQGTAVYNVTPAKVGKYFSKIQCFCFTEQVLQPGEQQNMPVVFFIDPSIMNDKGMDDIKTITLSYTFFKSDSQELEQTVEGFYNGSVN